MESKFLIILKLIFFFYIVIEFGLNNVQGYMVVALFLINLIVFTLRERFYPFKYMDIIELITVSAASFFYSGFIFLFPSVILDFVYDEFYLGLAPVLIAAFYFLSHTVNLVLMIFCLIYAMIAYYLMLMRKRENVYKSTFDDERRLIYELEAAKTKLMQSSIEVAHMTEIKERNRIARSLHDNVGHSIAGTYMQLQVALKLYGKNDDKAKKILAESTERISETLTLMRNTVHNIVPKEEVGIEYIKKIIDNFKFCKVQFECNGDENLISPVNMRIMALNIKEALTNAFKYSGADEMKIIIDINEKYIRLYIKDNGIGCNKVKDGLGISSMRDRIKSVGGTISTNGDDGFLIVCIIPGNANGRKIFESTNS